MWYSRRSFAANKGPAEKSEDAAEAPVKKKEVAEQQAAKKVKRESNLAEKAKDSYKKVPPPFAGKSAKDGNAVPVGKCASCLGGGGHADDPKAGWTGSWNVKNRWPEYEFGITVTEWRNLPESERNSEQKVAATAEVKARLKAELEEIRSQSSSKPASVSSSVRTQSFSSGDEDELENSHSERAEIHDEICIQCDVHELGHDAKKLQGFSVKTPEEFDKEAQIPRARAPDLLERKEFQAGVELSGGHANVRGTGLNLPKDMDQLLALEELEGNDIPEPIAGAEVEVNEVLAQTPQRESQSCCEAGLLSREEVPLDEMPMGIVKFLRTAEHNVCGHGLRGPAGVQVAQRHTGTGDGIASMSGELILYKAVLLDTGAHCNLITHKVVKRLGLAMYEESTGAKVARCDSSPTEFNHYCFVDVIQAAGTPRMILHRVHAFIRLRRDYHVGLSGGYWAPEEFVEGHNPLQPSSSLPTAQIQPPPPPSRPRLHLRLLEFFALSPVFFL
ncbi:hypothetical protein CYMTET_18989 [Cymbomonas tetramitiformis]|uniref:Uncharacterized protein n=1 Tax=Cymbomonas tetramitiformis TaxID=36881 RepID=A0AAE0L5C3_9CHLO|nr:hypothetical protein CYMTET_18989 [Cymbomonas tetramitiformis]